MSVAAQTPISTPGPGHRDIHTNHTHHNPYEMSYPTPDEQRPYTSYYTRPPGSSHGQGHPPQPSSLGIGVHAPPTAPPSAGTSPTERLHSSHGYAKGGPPPPESPVYHDMTAPPGSSHGYPQPQPSQGQGQPNPHQSPITPISANAYPPQPPSAGYYGLSTPDEHIPSPPGTSNGRPSTAQFTPDGVPIVPVGVSGGKMFRCRGYGECDKVFTRSEHLARHVRKHTGERPFPCHCGKAFSRLDNLRQHSATVHSDQVALNEAMLNSLAPVHAALSQKAGREQRKRGEIVEVPKNAVERPRHNEYRGQKTSPGDGGSSQAQAPLPPPQEYDQYQQQGWNERPRIDTGYSYEYPPGQVPEDNGGGPGPSRRPLSGGYQPYPYYDQTRPPTASGTNSSGDSVSQLPYPYRPMSSSGRDLPLPTHYSESEPPSSAHGPPQSPMYPPVVPHAHPHGQWSSPTGHATYPPPPETVYPPPPHHPHTDTYYDASPVSANPNGPPTSYGPPPPGSAGGSNSGYSYPPPPATAGYYPPPHSYGAVPPPQAQYPPAPPASGPYSAHGQTPESPFQYHAPAPGSSAEGQYPYPAPQAQDQMQGQPTSPYDRKRRAEDVLESDEGRKHHRPSSAIAQPQNLNEATQPHSTQHHLSNQEPLWLPPTAERRSSLAISALLGSPQQAPRSRPATATTNTGSALTSSVPLSSAAQTEGGSGTTAELPAPGVYPPQPYPTYVPQEGGNPAGGVGASVPSTPVQEGGRGFKEE